MGHNTASVQPPAQEQRIPASAVRALIGSRVFKMSGRWIALPAHLDAGACGTSWRHSWQRLSYLGCEPTPQRAGLTTIGSASLLQVVEKVRTAHGAAEVKRTWGVGYRALVAELSPKRGGAL